MIADPDVTSAVKDATMLVFVMPHQFLARTCPKITGMAPGCRAVSLIKGIEFEEEGPLLISKMIKDEMGGMDVSVLMGANVANEVAQDEFCESTVGYSDEANGAAFVRLFDCPTFRVGSINDVAGTELCGALKNVVALGAGLRRPRPRRQHQGGDHPHRPRRDGKVRQDVLRRVSRTRPSWRAAASPTS